MFFCHEDIRLCWAMPASPDRLRHEEKFNRGLRWFTRIFFASRCGLGSGFLDISICEACSQRPLGHREMAGIRICRPVKKYFY